MNVLLIINKGQKSLRLISISACWMCRHTSIRVRSENICIIHNTIGIGISIGIDIKGIH